MNSQRSLAFFFIVVAIAFVAFQNARRSKQPRPNQPVPNRPAPSQVSTDTIASLEGTAYQAAVEKVRKGDAAGAIEMLRGDVAKAQKASGTNSPTHATALYRLAAIYFAAGDSENAVEHMKQACQVVPNSIQSQKERLSYQMNLGEMLIHSKRIDEAEQVLRDSLREREAYYGAQHAGYAYGLEPLAQLLLKQNRPKEALPLITRARDICMHSHTPLTPQAFALRAFSVKAAGQSDAEAWEHVAELPTESRKEVYEKMTMYAGLLDGEYVCAALALAQQKALSDSEIPALIARNVGAALVQTARREGASTYGLKAIERMLPLAEAAGEKRTVVELLENKAMAEEANGDLDKATASYEAAVKRAAAFADDMLVSESHRNFGLFLSHHDKKDAAPPHLEAAVKTARKTSDKDCLGAALAAQGIFVQHNGDLARAQKILEESVAAMRTTHEHFLYAQNHLNAIILKKSCGCGDMTTAISDAIKRLIRERLPADWIKDIHVTIGLGELPSASVELARQVTPAEQEKVNLVVRQAIIDLQKARRN